jgi:hypothetical protein
LSEDDDYVDSDEESVFKIDDGNVNISGEWKIMTEVT